MEDSMGTEPAMLKTTFEGAEIIHRHLWEIVEAEAKLASARDKDWFNPSLVAMVFASHTVEAYLNFIGERIAPDIWKDERNYFRKQPYRGWEGKLRKVLELVGMACSPDIPPLKTVLGLKELRDLIAHGKPEKLAGEIIHPQGTDSPFPVSTLRGLITPKAKLATVMADIEKFLNEIHTLAAPKVNDPWFGTEALRGPSTYSAGTTTLRDA